MEGALWLGPESDQQELKPTLANGQWRNGNISPTAAGNWVLPTVSLAEDSDLQRRTTGCQHLDFSLGRSSHSVPGLWTYGNSGIINVCHLNLLIKVCFVVSRYVATENKHSTTPLAKVWALPGFHQVPAHALLLFQHLTKMWCFHALTPWVKRKLHLIRHDKQLSCANRMSGRDFISVMWWGL